MINPSDNGRPGFGSVQIRTLLRPKMDVAPRAGLPEAGHHLARRIESSTYSGILRCAQNDMGGWPMRREGVTASVMIDAGGASFEVHLTPGAIDALRIEEGKEVWLVIKTYSYNLVEPSAR
jgi:hypothetical protein